jgi:hypothetical protein
MKLDLRGYTRMLGENNIRVLYSGPLWANGIDGMAEMLIKRLEFDEVPFCASQAVFSVFVEQINNMMMYSAEKERKNDTDGNLTEVSKGVFVLGVHENSYFIQTGNLVTNNNAKILEERINHLNTLGKTQLRKYLKACMKADNDNPESKGAGLGLIVVARSASAPIEYEFTPYDEHLQYLSVYVKIEQGGKK